MPLYLVRSKKLLKQTKTEPHKREKGSNKMHNKRYFAIKYAYCEKIKSKFAIKRQIAS